MSLSSSSSSSSSSSNGYSNYCILGVIYRDTRAYILDLASRNFQYEFPYQEAKYICRNKISFYSYGSSESKMRLYLWCKFLRSSQCILIDKFQRCTCVHVVVVNHGFLFGLVVIQSFVNVQFFIKVIYFYFS